VTSTLSAIAEPARTARKQPLLYLLLECARPLAGGLRCSLAGVDEVRIGRGPECTRERVRIDGASVLRLAAPDPRASSAHARIVRVGARWALEDLGSKNGTFVNGSAEKRRLLTDGDVIETGETLWLFREHPISEEDGPGDLDTANLSGVPAGLRTLAPELEARFAALSQVARSQVSILVRGATGTGKELVARAVHERSQRPGRLVAVNCGAIPAALVESELFGSRRGAFSGATEDRPGWVRSADDGTLFLDEVGDFPAAAQPALLRVLQEREVAPVGDTRTHRVDFRAISATHRDLDTLVARGAFRADLLARLSGFVVELPSLADRREDLGLLVAAALARLPRPDGVTLSLEAARRLVRHGWPANIRELEQCLSAAAALAAGGRIELSHLPAPLRDGAASKAGDVPERAELDPADRALRDELSRLLGEHGGNLSAVARAMGKDRTQIRRWLERLGLQAARHRG
jgi:sigma-54 dependent transcriptional regulator, acetoin dehydrogenase operon transcriptional activator AcoR